MLDYHFVFHTRTPFSIVGVRDNHLFEAKCPSAIYLPGERKVVGGTAYDFRVPRLLKTMLPKIPMGGYDINFCITRGTSQDLAFQAR